MNTTTQLNTDDGSQFTISLYTEQDGRRMVYLSDDHHGDVTLPLDVFMRLSNTILLN